MYRLIPSNRTFRYIEIQSMYGIILIIRLLLYVNLSIQSMHACMHITDHNRSVLEDINCHVSLFLFQIIPQFS